MAIYPPIMASSQDSFLASTSSYPIYFTLTSATNFEDIKHIQIKIVYQNNNKSAVKIATYPDGIIYKPASVIAKLGGNNYSISISSSDLIGGWYGPRAVDEYKDFKGYYKVQICFGESELWSGGLDNFAAWRLAQVEQNKFSDWSTVMLIKAIQGTAEAKIVNQGGGAIGGSGDVIIEQSIDTELTTTPLFQGQFICSDETEIEDKYKFDLYDNKFNLLESTGWLQRVMNSGTDSYRFKTVLTDTKNYIVRYEIITINGYHVIAKNYEFTVIENRLTKVEGIQLIVESTLEDGEPYGDENGVLNVFLTSDRMVSGNYVLTRSSEYTNYTIWEDIKFFSFTAHLFEHEMIYQDFTIESGIKYKYAFQQENMAGLRTAPIYEKSTLESSPERLVNFQYSYLFRDGVQLKLRFDHKLSSFKRTVLATKQDTLGSKYPTINRNGDAYYAEFPMTGTISLHADDYLTFFTKKNDGYYYKGERVIKSDKYDATALAEVRENVPSPVFGQEDKYPKVYQRSTIGIDLDTYDTNLTDNNFFIERVFRDKVEEFLNDGLCKLYKSPSEGNIVVALMNVSLTPNVPTGRMIFGFSATAYEIMDDTLDNLDEYGIIHIGSIEENLTLSRAENETVLIGQIAGLFKAGENLIDLIREQNEYDIGGGYQYSFLGINTIQIEGYPKVKLTAELNELQANYIMAKTAGDTDLMESLQNEIDSLEELQAAIDNQVAHPIITVYINNKEISLGPNKIYQLKNSETITSLALKYTEPVIINYSCSVMSKESEKTTVYKVVTSSVWGQVAGIFTNSKNILDNYELKRNTDEFEVTSLKDHNFALYQSLDISEIIKERARHQVEDLYNTSFHFDKTILPSGQWTNGTIYYTFQKFKSIEIEADEGTTLVVTKEDGKTQDIIIGRTNKFRVQDLEGMIKNISLKEPAFIIVNYRCLTMQTWMGGD